MALKPRFAGCSGRVECTRKQKYHPNTWLQYSFSVAWSIDRDSSCISYIDNPDRLQTHINCIRQLLMHTATEGQIDCSKLISSLVHTQGCFARHCQEVRMAWRAVYVLKTEHVQCGIMQMWMLIKQSRCINRYSLHKVRCCSTHEITSDQVFMPALRLAFAQMWSQISFSSQLDS